MAGDQRIGRLRLGDDRGNAHAPVSRAARRGLETAAAAHAARCQVRRDGHLPRNSLHAGDESLEGRISRAPRIRPDRALLSRGDDAGLGVRACRRADRETNLDGAGRERHVHSLSRVARGRAAGDRAWSRSPTTGIFTATRMPAIGRWGSRRVPAASRLPPTTGPRSSPSSPTARRLRRRTSGIAISCSRKRPRADWTTATIILRWRDLPSRCSPARASRSRRELVAPMTWAVSS